MYCLPWLVVLSIYLFLRRLSITPTSFSLFIFLSFSLSSILLFISRSFSLYLSHSLALYRTTNNPRLFSQMPAAVVLFVY